MLLSLQGTKVSSMLDTHKKWLKKIFTAYAAADDSDDAILQADTMNVTEVLKMCNDAGLVGATLNVRAIRSIFAYVQQEEALLEEDGGGDPKPPAVDEGALRSLGAAGPFPARSLAAASRCALSARATPPLSSPLSALRSPPSLTRPIHAPADLEASEMVYSEFVEFLVAIAVFMQPNPYLVVDMRLDRFLRTMFYPALKKSKLVGSAISKAPEMA